jgi:GTP-binding protein
VVDEKTYRNPFVVADIPGLISGASEGRGLGNRFLRHVARARLLALVLDASEDPDGSEATLRAELYAAKLSDRPTVVVLNKIDTLDGELRAYLREAFPGSLQVSALTGEGVEELRDLLEERLRALGEQQLARTNADDGRVEHRVFRLTFRGLRVEEVGEGVYEVSGEDVERLALRTDWDSTEGVANFQRELEKKGVVAALKKAGAEPGDDIRVGAVEFDYQ